MKKRLASLVTTMILVLSVSITAHAENFSGGDNWSVTFDGKKMESTFKNVDIDDAISQLQPGDSIDIHLKLKNSYKEATNWYMSNEVLQSLEDTNSTTAGGAYAYILTYVDEKGTSRVLYSSEAVGGETVNESGEGLHQATNSLKDFFYLDQLSADNEAEIILVVKLEGETQGNSYQDTLAKLQMNFAVELTDNTSPGILPFSKFVKTGDNTRILFYSLLALIAGIICTITVIIRIRREQLNLKKEKDTNRR